MTIPVDGDGRFRTLKLTVDREASIGEQVIVARAAGYTWKHLCALFGLSRQSLYDRAEAARARLGAGNVPSAEQAAEGPQA